MGIEYRLVDDARFECFHLGKGAWEAAFGDRGPISVPRHEDLAARLCRHVFPEDLWSGAKEYCDRLAVGIAAWAEGRTLRLIGDDEDDETDGRGLQETGCRYEPPCSDT